MSDRNREQHLRLVPTDEPSEQEKREEARRAAMARHPSAQAHPAPQLRVVSA